jgi:hypothetical protein
MTKWFAFETLDERNACPEAKEPGNRIIVNSYQGKDPAGNPAVKTLRQYWTGSKWADLVPGEFIPAAPTAPIEPEQPPVEPPIEPPTPPHIILDYPFGKAAWCNRSIGIGREGARADLNETKYYGIPAAGNNGSEGPKTAAIPMKADRSNPLGDVIGLLKLEGGEKFIKYLFPYSAANRLYEVMDVANGNLIRKENIPSAMELIFGVAGKDSGTDNNLSVYIEEADEVGLYFSADFNTNDGKWYVKFRRKYSMKGSDHGCWSDGGEKGSCASGFRHPAGHYLWKEYIEVRKIRHAFQASVTRGAKGAIEFPRTHILGPNRIRPAVSMDGSAANNKGKMPYGGLLAIPYFLYGKRNQLGLDPIGLEFFDALRFNGIRVSDGNGEMVNNNTQGVVQLRIQQTSIIQQPPTKSFLWPSSDRDRINAQLKKLGGLLYPIMVTKGFEGPGLADSEYDAESGLYFAGGGKAIDPGCQCMAWDA